MNTQPCLHAQPRGGHRDEQRAVQLLRAAAACGAGQSDARREWIRASTQC